MCKRTLFTFEFEYVPAGNWLIFLLLYYILGDLSNLALEVNWLYILSIGLSCARETGFILLLLDV